MTMLRKKTTTKAPTLNVALAYQGFVDEPVPSALFDSIESGMAKRVSIAAIAIGALLSGLVISSAYGKFSTSTAPLTPAQLPANDIALSAHKTFAADLVHPVQVTAEDMEHLESWLAYRVGKQVSLAAYDDVGFTLVGANVIPDGEDTSSMVIYENPNKERISVFTRYFDGSYEMSNVSSNQAKDLNLLSWHEQGAQHSMVSSLSLKQMRTVFNTHYQ